MFSLTLFQSLTSTILRQTCLRSSFLRQTFRPFLTGKSRHRTVGPFLIEFYRFEFQHNEFVTALECVSLETQSTESGSKEFVIVGTTINRGEDLAVKGAVS